MGINLQLPSKNDILKPTITVVGVGGAGGNAVNNMIAANLEGVNFVVANTDAQALEHALTDRAIQLGTSLTRGLGAGANPDIGRAAAEEAHDEISAYIEGSNMVFITAGMGGGTGTGAAPVVARLAREQGILTVAVVTKPFQFEGTHRMRLAEAGLKELQDYVDTLIIIPNQNLFRIANERTTFSDAFKMADEVLHSGVRGVTDLMVKPGLINLDFADIRTVMREMGKAMMGTGEATGERRAVEAAEAAISNPLLDDVSLKGARAALINITGGPDMTLFEVDEAANRIREEVDPDANIIFGSAFNDAMEGRMRVSVVATGIDAQIGTNAAPRAANNPIEQKKPYLFTAGRAAAEPKAAPARPSYEQARTAMPAPAAQPAQEVERASQPYRDVKPVVAASVGNAALAFQAVQEVEPVHSLATAVHEEVRILETADAAPAHISPRRDAPLARESVQEESRSLFARIAEVSRSLAPRHDPVSATAAVARQEPQLERQLQVTEKPRPEVVKSSKPLPEEDTFLDIPAFLRRQAN